MQLLSNSPPDADKVSAQSKDEDCMYLKIKQADLNNPFIRQYLGYDKVIRWSLISIHQQQK